MGVEIAGFGRRARAPGDPGLIGSDKVEGTPVYRPDGKRAGQIERVMIDKLSGKVAYAVMSFGGFLGIGEDYYPLPWSLLTYNPALGGYEVNIGRGAAHRRSEIRPRPRAGMASPARGQAGVRPLRPAALLGNRLSAAAYSALLKLWGPAFAGLFAWCRRCALLAHANPDNSACSRTMHGAALQGRAASILANGGNRNFAGLAGEGFAGRIKCADIGGRGRSRPRPSVRAAPQLQPHPWVREDPPRRSRPSVPAARPRPWVRLRPDRL